MDENEKVEIKKKTTKEEKDKFTKEQLINAKKYFKKKYLLKALLDDENSYSHDEVDQLLKKFYEKEVK
jgi:hypothetical protein